MADEYEPTPDELAAQAHEHLHKPEIASRLSKIARRFPCLRGAPGIEPFDIDTLFAWAIALEHTYWERGEVGISHPYAATMHAVKLFARICGYANLRALPALTMLASPFDVYPAVTTWDVANREAFAAWACEGWVPFEPERGRAGKGMN